jgi:hypothetical protein
MQLAQNIQKESDLIHGPIQNPDFAALPPFLSRRLRKDKLDRLVALLRHNDKPADTNGLRGWVRAGLDNTLNIARKLMLLHYYHIE